MGTASAIDAEITSFSNNYTSDSDKMFNCTQTTIQFNISVADTTNITWYNDKTITTGDNGSLIHNYTVSDTDIHEIRAETDNGTSTDVVEWVITNKSLSDAPYIFDYFTDKKYKARTDTDPWGRSLPNWTEGASNNKNFDISNSFLYLVSDGGYNVAQVYTNSSMKYGTWILWERVNATGVSVSNTLRQFDVLENTSTTGYGHYHSLDGHNYFNAPLGDGGVKTTLYEYMSLAGVGENYADVPVWEDSSWNEFKIIHEQDGNWYLFKNDVFVDQSYENSDLTDVSDRVVIKEQMNIPLDHAAAGQWFEIDMIQAYRNEYLFPSQNISYGYFISDRWTGSQGPFYFWAIKIIGRDITLADINSSLDNQSLFSYNDTTKIATLHTGIYLESGASMLIEDSTLNINTSTGMKIFNVRNGAELIINNSEIDTTSDTSFRWQFPSAYDVIITDYGLQKKFNGIVEIRNSTINNTCYFNIHSGDRTIIEDSIFSNVRACNPHGNNIYSMSFMNWFKTENFTFDNITVTSKTDEIDLKFIDGDCFGEVNIYNSNLSDVNLDVRYSTDDLYRATPHTKTVNLINTLYNNISQTTNTILRKWYYFEFNITDSYGNNPTDTAYVHIDGNITPRKNKVNTEWTSSLDEGYNHHDIGFLKLVQANFSNNLDLSNGVNVQYPATESIYIASEINGTQQEYSMYVYTNTTATTQLLGDSLKYGIHDTYTVSTDGSVVSELGNEYAVVTITPNSTWYRSNYSNSNYTINITTQTRSALPFQVVVS